MTGQLRAYTRAAFALLLTVILLLALTANLRVALRAAADAPTGPVCVGLIVTGCAPTPPKTSPAAFLAVLILGGWGTIWISRNTQTADDEEPSQESADD